MTRMSLAMRGGYTILALVLAALALLLSFSPAAFATMGGDIITPQFPARDQRPGKQTPVASITDAAGNTYITGYELPPASAYPQFYTVKMAGDGTLAWRAVYQQANQAAIVTAMAVDSATGDVFVAGNVAGDVIILKYAAATITPDPVTKMVQETWVKTFDNGGTHISTATAMALDGTNVYVAGSARYNSSNCFMVLAYAKADGSQAPWQVPNAVTNITGTANSIAVDASGIAITGMSLDNYFQTIKYNLDGSHAWNVKNTNLTHNNDAGLFVKIDSAGDVVATGKTYDGSHNNIFTAKYAKDSGTVVWSQTTALEETTEPDGLYLDQDADPLNSDNVYVTGHTSVNGFRHIYTVRYKSGAANPQTFWPGGGIVFDSGSNNIDSPTAIVVDPASDSLFVTGYTSIANNSDFRTIKYRKSTGDLLWSRTFHGVANNNDQAIGIGLGLDSGGNPFVSGYADETAPLHSFTATVDNGSKSVLEDSTTSGTWAGYWVKMTNGANSGQTQQILSNTATSLTLVLPLSSPITAGDNHYIYDKEDQDYYVVKYDRGMLNAPSDLTAAAASNSSITLNWRDNNAASGSDPTTFRVERCTAQQPYLTECGTFSPVADDIAATTFTDSSGLDPDTYYYYRVTAHNTAAGDTYPSNTAHAATQYVAIVSSPPAYSYAGMAPSLSNNNGLSIAINPANGNPVVTGNRYFTPGGFDYYTIRLDRDLNKLWSQRYGEPQLYSGADDVDTCLAIDSNGQIIVSGFSFLNNDGTDMDAIYTIKYKAGAPSEPVDDPALLNEWDHQYNAANGGNAQAIAVATATDSSDNIALVGMGLRSPTDYDKHDIYVLHYPPNGPGTTGSPNPGYWAATPIRKMDDNQPTAIVVDPWGDVIITGFVGNLPNSATNRYSIYTAKFSGSTATAALCPADKVPGCLLWEQSYNGGIGNDEPNDVTVDKLGNVYVTGFATINAQGDTAFITIKYDKDGVMQWGGTPRITSNPLANDDEAVAVRVDPIDGNIVVAGDWLTGPGNHDYHVIRYRASDGNELWHKTLLREGSDEDLVGMAMDSSGSLFVTGSTTDNSGIASMLTVKLDWEGNLSGTATGYNSTATPAEAKPFGIAANYLGETFVAGYTKNADTSVSNVVMKIDGDAIQSVYPLAATPGYATVTLNWADNSRAEEGYQVARRDGACPGEPVLWDTNTEIIAANLAPDTVSYPDSGRTSGATYCYGVRAFKGTDYSRWANTTVTTGIPQAPDMAPQSPDTTADTGYGAVATSTTSVTVTWGLPAYAPAPTGFEIWRCLDGPGHTPCSGADFTLLDTAGGTATSYADTTVCPGSTYRYQVRATGSGWVSPFSASSGVIPPTADNLMADSGFESVDPITSWPAKVNSNQNYFLIGNIVADDTHNGVGNHVVAMATDNSAIRADSGWGLTTAPTQIATVGAKTAVTNGPVLSNPGSSNAWKSLSPLTNLAANTVISVTIPRNTAIADGSEPLANYRDIRFYGAYNTGDTPAEIPCLMVVGNATNTSATFWFKTGTNTANISVYYGNATATQGSAMSIAKQALGRKQPVLMANNGMYTLYASLKSDLDYGSVNVDLLNATRTSSVPISIDSYTGGTNIAFNKDGSWHDLNADYTSTLAGQSYVRYYLNRSGPAVVPYYYPSGSAAADDIRLVPNYNLAAARVSEMQVNLSWAASSYDATGYKIERCAGVGCSADPANFSQIATVTSGTTSYTDGVLTPATSYSYRIRPYKTFAQSCTASPGWNGGGWDGGYSNTATIITTNNPPSPFTATAANTTQVNLAWTDTTTNETNFQVVRGPGTDCDAMSPLATVAQSPGIGSSVSFNDTTACNNTAYNYCVKAVSQGLAMTGLSQAGGGTWTSRVKLDFGAPASTFKPNLLTRMIINQLTGMDAAFKDIRFHDASAGVELPYWIQETSGTTATVWIKTGNNDNIYLYFGNPSAISGSSQTTVLGSGLVGYWPFSEAIGTYTYGSVLNDRSGQGNHLGMTGFNSSYGIVDGGVFGGHALSTSGSQYMYASRNTPANLPNGTASTTEAWVYPTGYPDASYNGIVSWGARACNGQGYALGMHGQGRPELATWCNDAVYTSGPTAVLNAWNHVAVVQSGTAVALWLNGQKTNLTLAQAPSLTSTNLAIGVLGYNDRAFQGRISEVRIYNRALSDAEMATHYAASLPTVATPLQANVVTDTNGLQPQLPVLWDGPFSTAAATTQAIPSAPTLAPAGVTRYSEERIDIAWTFTSSDQTGFRIDRCSAAASADCLANFVSDSGFPVIAPGGAAVRSYSDTGLTYNTTYWYRVRAYKTENPSCNGGAGFWETADSAIQSQNTNLPAPGALGGSNSIATDCADFRFMDSDDTTKLNYYLASKDDLNSQCNKATTKLIVKVPSIPAGGKQLKLYYGNLQAASASSGGSVFDFFDDFDGSAIDTSKWTVTDGTGFSVANSKLTGTNTTGRLISKAPYTFGPGYSLQARVKSATRPTNGYMAAGFFNSWYDNTGWLHSGSPNAVFYSNNNAFTQMTAALPGGTSLTDALQFNVTLKSASSFNPTIYDWEGSNNTLFWDAGDRSQTVNTRPIAIGRRYDDSSNNYNNQAYTADWEWIRVRKYASPAPSGSLGLLDTAGAPYALPGETGSWLFRKPVTVSYDAAGVTLSNYQVNVVLDTIALGTDRNTLTWTDTTSSETGFTLERCDGADCSASSFPRISKSIDVSPQSGAGSSVSYIDKDTIVNAATTNYTYCYRVKAVNAAWTAATPTAGETPYSNTVCMTTVNPTAPSNLQASAQTGTITVTWNDNSANETGFTLERCQDDTNGETACAFLAGNNYAIDVPANNAATASFTDSNTTGLPCSGTFRYRISAYKSNPDGTSWVRGPSAVAGPATLSSTPATPTGVSATRNSEQQITIGWADTYSGESGFEIYRCSGAGCTPTTLLTTSAANTISYIDTNNIVPGTTYGYQVKVKVPTACGDVRSLPSSTAYAIASFTGPSNFSTVTANTTQANLAWTDNTAAESGFSILRCSGPPPCATSYGNVAIAAAGSGTLTYNDTSVCADTTYTYVVSALESPSLPLSNPGTQPVWRYKAPLVFSDFTPNTPAQVIIPYDSGMQTNFADIRFYDRTAQQELPYWIRYYNASYAIVWFKTGANAGIDLYYGNPNAVSSSSSAATLFAGNGLAAFWPFEEADNTYQGSTADISGNNLNGSLANLWYPNGIYTSAGKIGNGLKRDSTSNYWVSVADTTSSALDITGSMTIELWYQFQTSDAWARLISKPTTAGAQPWDLYAIQLNNASQAYFVVNSANALPATTLASPAGPVMTAGTWYHLVGRYDATAGKMSLFVNGVEYSNTVTPITIPVNNETLGISSRGAYGNYAKGMYDEVRIYNRALSDREIANHYSGSVTIGPKSSTANPVKLPLAFTAFQANTLAKIVVPRNPSGSAGNNPRPDFRDLRFLDRDANRELPYWIRTITRDGSNNPIAAEIWFLPGDSANIDLNYGNATTNYASSDTMGWWPFEEFPTPYTSGATSDMSGWGLNGTLAANFTAPNGIAAGGKYGNGLKLDGTGNYVTVADSGYPNSPLDITGAMTVEGWYYYDGTNQSGNRLAAKLNSDNTASMYALFVDASGVLRFLVKNASGAMISTDTVNHDNAAAGHTLNSTPTLSVGWHHIAGTYNIVNASTAEVAVYIDGVKDVNATTGMSTAYGANAATPVVIGVYNTPLTIGANAAGSNSFLGGMLDDVRIYNRALTAAEIQARANEGASLQVATIVNGAVGYWPFEENAGTLSGYTADRSGTNPVATGVFPFIFATGYGIQAGGKYGNGLKLDGASTYISIPVNAGAPLDITGSMTIDLWYYYDTAVSGSCKSLVQRNSNSANQAKFNLYLACDGTANGETINSTYRTVNFSVIDGNNVAFRADKGGTTGVPGDNSQPLLNNAWNHLVARYDAAQGKISVIVNGVERGVNSTLPGGFTAMPASGQPIHIGNKDTTNYAKGIIDEVAIYDRPLTDQEILAHYNATAPVEMKTAGTTVSTTVVTANPANVLTDPDMESGSAYWWNGVGTTLYTYFEASGAYSGKAGLYFNNASNNATKGRYQAVNVTPGAQYQLSGYLKTNLTAGQAQCDVYGLNSSSVVSIDSPGIFSSGSSDWTYKTETVTIPADTTSVQIRCFASSSPAGQAWVDMVQFVRLAPLTLTATRVSEAAIDLGWNDFFTEKTGYNIYRCMDSGSACTFGATPYRQVTASDIPFHDLGLLPNQTYRYKVAAYKAAICPWESTASNTVSQATGQLPITDLSVSQPTATSLKLTWTDRTNSDTGYNIYRCMGNGCEPCTDPSDCATTTATYSIPAANLPRSLDQWRKAYYPMFSDLADRYNNQATGSTNLSSQITGLSNVSGLSMGTAVAGPNIQAGTTITDIFSDPASWTKRDNAVPAKSDTSGVNGLIPLANTNGRGDYFWVEGQGVLKDDDQTYKMWYSGMDVSGGSWRIYYATSADGLVWAKKDNTLLAPSNTTGTNGRIPLGTDNKNSNSNTTIGDGVHAFISQSVLKDGTLYKMWYSGYDGKNWRIYYATSTDGLSWTKVDNTIPAPADTGVTPTNGNGRLPLGTGTTGDSSGVFGPTVIKDGPLYKMWYSGNDGATPTNHWRIYYATSTDGLNWTKLDNSVPANTDSGVTPTDGNGRLPLGNATTGDSSHAYTPTVIKDGLELYRMWYSGSNGSNWRIYYATSTDGLNWTKQDNSVPATPSDTTGSNGRIPLGNATKGDSTGVFGPAVVKDGTNYRMWYSGFDDSGIRRIYHANSLTTVTLSKNPTAAASGTFVFGPTNGQTGTTDPVGAAYQIIGLANTSGLVPSMSVSGPNIPAGTTISAINSSSTITISTNPTAAASGNFVFGLNLLPTNGPSYTPSFDASGGLTLTSAYYSYYSPANTMLDNDNHTIEFDIKFSGSYGGTNNNIITYAPSGGPSLVVSTKGWGNSPSQQIKLTWSYNGSGIIDLNSDAYGLPFVVGKWYHLRGTKNGSALTLYVNDLQTATATVPVLDHAPGSRSAPLQIEVGNSYAPNVAIKNLGISSGYTGSVDAALQTFTDMQLCPGNRYNYRVMPFNNLVPWTGATSNSAGNTTNPLNPPTWLSATAKSESVVGLTWTPSNENDQTAFTLMECHGGTCTTKDKDAVGNALAYDWSGLTGDATPYCFYVASWKDACGGVTSAYYPRVDDMLNGANSGTWSSMAPITITNPMANFQTRLVVGYLTGMKTDFSDIRLFNSTTKREIPYWVEQMVPGTSATLWFKTPNSTGDAIYLYYGNPAATTPTYSGSSVFEFFDDFDGTLLDTATWSISTGGSATVSGGRLNIALGSVYTKNTLPNLATPMGMTFEMKNSWTTATTGASGISVCNAPATYSGNGSPYYAHADLRMGSASGLLGIAGDGAATGWNVVNAYLSPNSGIPANSDVNVAGQDRLIGVEYQNATNLNFYSKDPVTYALQYLPATTNYPSVWNPTGPTAPYLYLGHIWGSNSAAATIYPMSVDWVRVRKYAATPPSASIGTPGTRDGSDNTCLLIANTQLITPTDLHAVNEDGSRDTTVGTSGYIMSPYPYKIPLAWTDNSQKETSYIIDRKVWNGQWVQRAVTNNSTSFMDTVGIEPRKAYTYRVRAVNANDGTQSPLSSEFTISTPAFTGGDGNATCICSEQDGKPVCQ